MNKINQMYTAKRLCLNIKEEELRAALEFDSRVIEKILQDLSRQGLLFLTSLYQLPRYEELQTTLEKKSETVQDVFDFLLESKVLLRLSDGLIFHQEAVEKARVQLSQALDGNITGITVSEFCKMLGTSRKYGLSLLQYFDNLKITRRVGDRRVLV